MINEIYQSYIEEDISYLLKIRKTDEFSNLVRVMAAQLGSLVNFSELSSTVGISVGTLKDYIWYLEKTLILKRINPYFKNVRKEITKSPIFYYYDLGLRNFACGNFGSLQEKGFVFQNFVFNVLREMVRLSSSKICFWRTKDKAEIDFVVDSGRNLIPIEVKYQKFTEPRIPTSLRSFIKKYKPEKGLIVNLSRICIHALYSLLPAAFAMLYDVEFPWLADKDVKKHACPDASNPVTFELRKIREE